MKTHMYLAHIVIIITSFQTLVKLSPFSIVVADLTNEIVAELTAVVAELTAVVAELDVAESACRRVGCRRPDLSPT